MKAVITMFGLLISLACLVIAGILAYHGGRGEAPGAFGLGGAVFFIASLLFYCETKCVATFLVLALANSAPAQTVKTYPEALATAKARARHVFVYFGAPWCGPCKRMKAETFADPNIALGLKAFVVLHLDLDANKSLAKQFGVTSVPAYFVVDGAGKVLRGGVGFRAPSPFLDWLLPLME